MAKPKKQSSLVQQKAKKQHKPSHTHKNSSKSASDNNVPANKDTPKTGFQVFMFLANTIISVFVTFFALHWLCTKQHLHIFVHNKSSQQQMLFLFSIINSIIIGIHAFCADWLQLIFNKTNNDLYRSNRNTVNNNILWGFIFIAAYFYNPNGTRVRDTELEAGLFDLFIIGRMLFSVGYVMGAIIGHQSFRAVGFGICLGCCVIMIGEALNFSVVQYFLLKQY